MSKNKISMFQVTAMFMLLVIAPIVRGFPVRAAGIGGKAAGRTLYETKSAGSTC